MKTINNKSDIENGRFYLGDEVSFDETFIFKIIGQHIDGEVKKYSLLLINNDNSNSIIKNNTFSRFYDDIKGLLFAYLECLGIPEPEKEYT